MYVDFWDMFERCVIYSLSTVQLKIVIWYEYNKKSRIEIAELEEKSYQYVTYHLNKAYKQLGVSHTS